MLSKVEFENFMSLKNVSIKLEPLTVFIGANASGKSAIFKGLVSLSKLLNGAPVRGGSLGEFIVEDGVTLDDVVWGGDSGLPIRFRIWFEGDDIGGDPTYSLELRKKSEGWSVTEERIRAEGGWIEVDESQPFKHPTEAGVGKTYAPPMRGTLRFLVHHYRTDPAAYPVIKPVIDFAERFGQVWRYRVSASDVAAYVQPPREGDEKSFYVRENGRGVALAIQDLISNQRDVFQKIEQDACKLFSHIKAINVKRDHKGVRLAFATDRSYDRFPAPLESDGALLATFLLWRLHTAHPSVRVCLEEPESGLHPELIRGRYEILKAFAYSSTSAVQILVATHSPELLRVMHTHHSMLFKEARLVGFAPNSGTSVKVLDSFREAGNLIEQYLSGK